MDEFVSKSSVGRRSSRRAARIVVRQAFVIRHDSTRRMRARATTRRRDGKNIIHEDARET